MNYKNIYKNWLSDTRLNEEGRAELAALANDGKETEYRFGAELNFGTAGMRGIIGYGINMLNIYTVMRATKGLAQYLKNADSQAAAKGVAISYDTRKYSQRFAKAAAGILAQSGIKAYIFDGVRPAPMLSYAVRKLGAAAGIMITASHNPKEYNGYKVYGSDGAQLSPEATQKAVEQINAITDYLAFEETGFSGDKPSDKLIKVIGKKIDKAYYKELKRLALSPLAAKKTGKDIKLVYTPLHGSGYIPVMTVLKKLGIKATPVAQQTVFDPNFSTVEVPNPELEESLTAGIALADKINADVVFGTDPDCDRLGVAVRGEDSAFTVLSGNQTGILLLDYILTRLKEEDKIPENGFIVKSFVSTSMAKAIAEDFGVELIETPVGFKFIGEKIKTQQEEDDKQFIFGFEESCGYLRGTHCRDKDAVVASMLFAEMVCYYTHKNTTVYKRLQNIYDRYGFVLDKTVSIAYSGLSAMKEMNAVINALKNKKIDKFDIFNIVAIRDYSRSVRITSGGEEIMDIPPTDCIYYEIENGSFVCLRPSGTEPKLKIYYSVKANDAKTAEKFYNKLEKAVRKIITK